LSEGLGGQNRSGLNSGLLNVGCDISLIVSLVTAMCLHRLLLFCPLCIAPRAKALLWLSLSAPSLLSSPSASPFCLAPSFRAAFAPLVHAYLCVRLHVTLCFHMLHWPVASRPPSHSHCRRVRTQCMTRALSVYSLSTSLEVLLHGGMRSGSCVSVVCCISGAVCCDPVR